MKIACFVISPARYKHIKKKLQIKLLSKRLEIPELTHASLVFYNIKLSKLLNLWRESRAQYKRAPPFTRGRMGDERPCIINDDATIVFIRKLREDVKWDGAGLSRSLSCGPAAGS
jgi:hypothetical protein